MLSREEVIGKWLWSDRSVKLHVLGKATGPDAANFYMVEEPGSPWGPRPLHYDFLKDCKVIDENFKPDEITAENGTETGFCSCCLWRAGSPNITIKFDAVMNSWDMEKVAKQTEEFFHAQGMKNVHVRAHPITWPKGTGKCEMRFFVVKDNPNLKDHPMIAPLVEMKLKQLKEQLKVKIVEE